MIIGKGITFGKGIQVGESAQEYPTYSMTVSKTTITENNDVLECTVTTTGLLDGTILFWSTSGTLHSSQLKTTSGYAVVKNRVAVIRIVSNPNNVADGSTSFNVRVHVDSVNNPPIATSPEIFVVDSSNPTTGQADYGVAGNYLWTAPFGVNFVSVLCIGGGSSGTLGTGNGGGQVGGGGGGGGGGLGWKNNIQVIPGQTYAVTVGEGGAASASYLVGNRGGDSFFIDRTTVMGGGGNYSLTATVGGAGGTYVGDGGGNGGEGGKCSGSFAGGGGGGAGGYSGNGGKGADAGGSNATAGSGGGGGGGTANGTWSAGGGGGVGIYGQGASGAAGAAGGYAGGGGSGGGAGVNSTATGTGPGAGVPGGMGGLYGGGGGGAIIEYGGERTGAGRVGAVRIIWGPNRSFPSSLTTDQTPI